MTTAISIFCSCWIRGRRTCSPSGTRRKRADILVVEIVCANPVKLKKAKSACAGYTNRIALPNVGEHVRVTGTHVIDSHNGWAEIHPVSRIEKL